MSYIYMVYTWYIQGYTMYIHQTGYTWYILGYTMYIMIQLYWPSIYMVYPYMVYHWMYMHGIYVVYCGISIDIPSFLKPDFAAGPCCWSHSMRTSVWVIKSVLFHSPSWQVRQGKRLPANGSTRLPPTFPACRWWLRWRQRRRRCRGRLSVSCCGQRLESWWKMGAREPSGQVSNVSNSLDDCLRWKSRKKLIFYLPRRWIMF